jgi:uncharacterized protein
MLVPEFLAMPVELKFDGDGGTAGVFSGYGAATGNEDSYGHVISAGAFKETLAAHEAAGTMPGMYIEHSPYQLGGDLLPVGVWQQMSEDSKGLFVRGKLSALDTDYGKRIRALMLDGAVKALSIAFNVPEGGDVRSKTAGEPRRTINNLVLHSVDIVRDPANKQAQVLQMNSALQNVINAPACIEALAACIRLHHTTLAGTNSPTGEQRLELLGHLMDAHRALTGVDVPPGTTLSAPTTLRELEAWLRVSFKLSRSQSETIAEVTGFKAPRDEAVEKKAEAEARAATLKELSLIVSSLTSKG